MTPSAIVSLADSTLAQPPALARIVRPVPRGVRVARFGLPLELCKPQNARDGSRRPWVLARTKSQLSQLMAAQWLQHRDGRALPLPGRPQVLCLRLSSREPDAYSDWAKAAIDILTAHGRGHRH